MGFLHLMAAANLTATAKANAKLLTAITAITAPRFLFRRMLPVQPITATVPPNVQLGTAIQVISNPAAVA